MVKLSIVLVILGLLTGQSLIHAAELRSIISDSQRYHAAINTFHDQYFGLPGDTNITTNMGKG